jgi:pimeloyl-ACP methyl ester carboxylesterase
MRRVLAVAMVLAFTAVPGCSNDKPSGLVFGSCEGSVDLADPALSAERRAQLDFGCATLKVPVDHDEPGGAALGMRVVRVRAKNQHDRIGSLVLNFGGPGQSGVERMSSWPGRVSAGVLERFDLVSFDPRGVGQSEGVRCRPQDPPSEPDHDLLTPAGFAAQVAQTSIFVGECTHALGARAALLSTEQTARDIEALRVALGDEQLTYVGLSYGAKLGAEYVRRFPDQVRAAVLDAPSDPRADPVAVHERQIAGFEASFADYAAACGTRATCRSLGAPPRQVLADLVRGAALNPIPTGKPGDDREARPSDLLLGVVSFLYDDDTWPALDQSLREARDDGDSTAFFEVADAFNPPPVEGRGDSRHASFVINCNDTAAGVPTEAVVRASLARMVKADPVFGSWGGYGLFGCQYWQPERSPLALPTSAAGPQTLVVGTVHDPATPYAGAVALAEVMGARLLTWEGAGHTAVTQTACIDRWVDAYLIDRVLPPTQTRCAA